MQSAKLHDGDEIRAGHTVFRVSVVTHELRTSGWLIQAIADELNVCAASVHVYLKELHRPGSASTN